MLALFVIISWKMRVKGKINRDLLRKSRAGSLHADA